MMKFKKEYINERLKPLGWELPQGIQYKGMLENHAVKCIRCGWIQEKRLDNLIYREEECPACGNGVFDGTMLAEFEKLKEAMIDLKATILDSLHVFGNPNESKQNTTDLKAQFRRYIAKKGYKMKGRKLMSDEWNTLSHDLSEELMIELSSSEGQLDKWVKAYVDLMVDHPTKQGQDILLAVIPTSYHEQLRDAIAKRMVKL